MTEVADARSRSTRRLVLIGSMSAYAEILRIAGDFARSDIAAVVPEAEGDVVRQLSLPDFEQFKRNVSFAYLKKIRDPRTYAVLAINVDRHGILNYIGPNTFAEIAVAFAQSKRIYLYQGIPDAYSDELSAWGGIPLHGRLDRLIDDFTASCMEEDRQLRLLE
jgi:hypothetical protein